MTWTPSAVAQATGAQLIGPADIPLSTVTTDTRTLEPGALFVALRGERFDGHDFLDAAWAAQAGAVLVSRDDLTPPAGRALLVVDDTLVAYGRLARWWRDRHDALVIGVTGSVGKSTTKELIADVLARRGPVLRSPASFNNEIGLPATLLQLSPEHDSVVLEMAMRGVGQIAYLAEIARPRIAVITLIGSSHVGLLGSRQAIAAAKGEILDDLGPDGVAVLNRDDPHQESLVERHGGRTLWYGLGPGCDVTAADVEPLGLGGTRFRLELPDARVEVLLPVPGRHMVANALAAAAAGHVAGVPAADIADALGQPTRLSLRLEVLTLKGGARVINDAYNASPESVRAAVEVLSSEPVRGRRIVVLGDMLEMGVMAEAEHLRLGQQIGDQVDVVIGVGELGARIAEGARDAARARVMTARDAAAAGALLADVLRPDDLVLLKASRAVALERALDALEVTR